ncbi:hypothetical protein PPUJ20066_27730 [Pseudomonas putida]|nr:hypothetical protein PPUJ20066_27730 [Pseudomonas putida]
MTVLGGKGLPWHLQCCENRAPPARRIASNARSYVCFGPVTPVAARATALFTRPGIEVDAKGPRANASGIIGQKQT